ncbi:RsmE family RNA methyltransferase [Patescibacteria group bacterium]|nr:RsmE family RNA methyltransferase [Patescibacteria group bacterium]
MQIIIGPEGGLSQGEISLAKKAKVNPFTFGQRILRTETAAISALSLVLLNKRT